MSDVVVSVIESTTNVTVTEQDVAVAVTETSVDVSSSTAGIQGASYNQGDPIYVTVRNSTGATLPKGSIVYTSGGNGTHTQVSPALATSDATSARVLGWLAESIANNASGLCQVEGYLDGINTQGITEGTQLYLSGTTAGAFQTSKPQAPIHLVYVGVAVKASAGNGRVYVKVQNGYELDELHDVQITSKADGDLLRYESSTDLWKNKAASTLTLAQSQVTNLVSDLAGKANLAGGNTFTGAQSITSTAIAQVPLTLNAVSGQTGNLFDVKNNSGTSFLSINNIGTLLFGTNSGSFLSGSNGRINVQLSADVVGITARGVSGQTANLQEWQNSAGTVQTYIGASGAIRTTGSIKTTALDGVAATLAIQPAATTTIGVVVRGAASQTANLQQWQNSAGTVVASVTASGVMTSLNYATTNSRGQFTESNSGAVLLMLKQTAATSNPGTGFASLYFRDGTTTGTLKLVVRAGAAGAETTILDNIPQ